MINNVNLAEKQPEIRIVSLDINTTTKKDLSSFSSCTTYNDDEWFLDLYFKKVNYVTALRRFNFTWIAEDQTKEKLKSYIYKLILSGYSLEQISAVLMGIKRFLTQMNIGSLDEITKQKISNYYDYLNKKDVKQNTIAAQWNIIQNFLKAIQNPEWKTMDLYEIKKTNNPINSKKYIPQEVLDQFDRLLKDEVDEILMYKLGYWLLRLWPNRGTEVFSFNIDCLKSFSENVYTLCSKVYKTAGSETGTPKMLLIDTNEPTQKFLYELIRKQQEVARKLYKEHPEMGDFLFLGHMNYYNPKHKKYYKKTQYFLMNNGRMNRFLREYAIRNNITYNGEPAKVTTHMFRHNTITDRVESKLFRPIDLRPMTHHANEEMFHKSYYHKTSEQVVEQTHEIEKKLTGDTLIFKGKIVNSMNNAAFNYFLERPAAFKLNGMGICVDSRACSKDKLQCLECKYFIPDCDNLGYFEEQLEEWKKKLDYARKLKNKIYEDNVIYNISLFENVINKIKAQLEKEEGND